LNYTPEELKKEIKRLGGPAYRAEQTFSWINKKGAAEFKEIRGIPGRLIAELEKRFVICTLSCEEHLVSRKDGTEKFLWKLKDGCYIETVLIKTGRRRTICLSTQVGCRFKCPFCASGAKGLIRDLEPAEIVNQVLCVQKIKKCRPTNVVFMGIGEPLDNYDNLEKAIRIINHPAGINLGARKITVSTCGIVPGIKKLKEIGLQVELSVSLHAADNKLRDKLAPVNRKYPLEKLIAACEEYTLATGRIITLEYTLIKGRNDSPEDAEKLGKIARQLKAKVNLIACNPGTTDKKYYADREEVEAFGRKVRRAKVPVTVRESKGEDILAACGQLAIREAGARRLRGTKDEI